MKDKELKDMTLNELLQSDLSLEDIDEVIEEQLESESARTNRDCFSIPSIKNYN